MEQRWHGGQTGGFGLKRDQAQKSKLWVPNVHGNGLLKVPASAKVNKFW